jgi:hypothetical protein
MIDGDALNVRIVNFGNHVMLHTTGLNTSGSFHLTFLDDKHSGILTFMFHLLLPIIVMVMVSVVMNVRIAVNIHMLHTTRMLIAFLF